MPEKLLSIEELSQHLGIKKEKIDELVNEGVITAYKLGGKVLRFRKEQVDAIRAEIEERLEKTDRIDQTVRHGVKTRERLDLDGGNNQSTAEEKWRDFLYFNDFYIAAGVIVVILLIIIFR
jgi:excisionase family DNA binding protein